MTIPRWYRVVGDTNDTLVAQLLGVADLVGVTAIEAHVWRPGVAATTLTTAVTDATARTVTVNLTPWIATAAASNWNLEIQVTFTGGLVRSWPAERPGELILRTQGA